MRAGTWVVAEVNQASQQVEEVHGPYWNEQEALEAADVLRTHTARVGRAETYRVASLDYVDEA